MRIIREMKKCGLTGAYCTPHIMQRFPNTPEQLRERFREFAARAADEDFVLRLAAEYMLDEGFEKAITSQPPLLWDDKYLLVELPQYMLPAGWMDSICLVMELGYVPVLAHPERYGRVLMLEDLLELAEQGVLFQGNTGSVMGYYGKRVQAFARNLQKHKLYHFWGTDAHSLDMFRHVARVAP